MRRDVQQEEVEETSKAQDKRLLEMVLVTGVSCAHTRAHTHGFIYRSCGATWLGTLGTRVGGSGGGKRKEFLCLVWS